VISYPGDVLARFGRYEAVEDRGPRGRAHLWRAWDPFVERFVVLAVLVDVSPAEMLKGWRHFDAALREWTGGYSTSADEVLDLAPPSAAPAFLVLRAAADADEPKRADMPTPPAPSGATGGGAGAVGSVSSAGVGRVIFGGLAALVAGIRGRW